MGGKIQLESRECLLGEDQTLDPARNKIPKPVEIVKHKFTSDIVDMLRIELNISCRPEFCVFNQEKTFNGLSTYHVSLQPNQTETLGY